MQRPLIFTINKNNANCSFLLYNYAGENSSSLLSRGGEHCYIQSITKKEDGILSNISKETVEKVANLAKLEVSDNEATAFAGQLGKIIELVEQLNTLDTSNVEPTSHAIEVSNVLREDVAAKGLDRKEVLKNAPDQQDGMFKVPTIMEQ